MYDFILVINTNLHPILHRFRYEVEGSRPRGMTWREAVQKDCQARNLNREDAMDRGIWKKQIKIG